MKGQVVAFNLPDVGEAIMTVVVKEWLVKPGDAVAMGDPVCEVQSDKSAATIYCPYDGVVTELMYQVDDVASKDQPLLMIELKDDGDAPSSTPGSSDVTLATEETPPPSSPSPPVAKDVSGNKILATPAVRKMAADNSIDLSQIKGTGTNGRILKDDIVNYIQAKETPSSTPVVSPIAPPTATPSDTTEPIKGFKMIMVRTMAASGQIPQFGYCDEILMDEAMQVRSQLRDILSDRGVKFSYMPLFVKALSLALKEYPILNAHVDQSCSNIIYKADHNIGIATDTSQGLVVPNIKQVQNKSVVDVAVELNRIHELSLKGSLSPDDIAGGTFSLSNIGVVS
jgi:2-oxoisovalerate dehydrogenase E2 component (dihydrolipoyl transacylase)